MADLIASDQLESVLQSQAPGWELGDASISRVFSFDNYMAGIEFVNEVAKLAEEANHHPDIVIGWRKVTLELSTHSAGGLTGLDFQLAGKITPLVDGA